MLCFYIVRLNNNKFNGTIPSELGNLSLLDDLWLYSNQFSGHFPEEIGHVTGLKSLWINDNKLKGSFPDVFGNLNNLIEVYISENKFKGKFPLSFWNLRSSSIQIMDARENNIQDNIPDDFCNEIFLVLVDDSTWFVENPKVRCKCCDTARCHLWKIDPKTVNIRRPVNPGGQPPRPPPPPPRERRIQVDNDSESESENRTKEGSTPTNNEGESESLDETSDINRLVHLVCPEDNVRTFRFSFNLEIFDQIANVTLVQNTGDNNDGTDICISPTGCYSVSFQNRRSDKVSTRIGYSSLSKKLVEQNQCDVVEICGTSFDASHPKRKGLNHITQAAVPDLSVLDNSAFPEFKALCWIMTEDSLFDEFDICDGTLLQRYVLALFAFTHGLPIDNLDGKMTCEWDSIKCDENNKFVTEINLSKQGLQGQLISEIGSLMRLEKIDLSDNDLTGSIEMGMLTNLQFLKAFNVGDNKIEGKIPKQAFELEQIQLVNVSNNLFTGRLPDDMKCADTLGK